MQKFVITLIACVMSWPLWSDSVRLRADSPARYVVQPGDSLWSIAARFLEKPWQWEAIWQGNPQISNPDRIYPGAVIELRDLAGTPFLHMTSAGTLRLSPMVREEPLDNAVPTIPLGEIAPFLTRTMVLQQDELQHMPYVVAYSGEHLMGGPGTRVFAMGIGADEHPRYSIYRDYKAYQDPNTRAILGYVAEYIGEAEIQSRGEPSVLLLTALQKGVEVGDRLMPSNQQVFAPYFQPAEPVDVVHGQIIDLFDGAMQIGTHQIVAINLGESDGVQPGDVLAIYKLGKVIPDPVAHKRVKLPNERIGEIMVFQAYHRVSFALVMSALEPVQAFYLVSNP